jgi:hypothetical protein
MIDRRRPTGRKRDARQRAAEIELRELAHPHHAGAAQGGVEDVVGAHDGGRMGQRHTRARGLAPGLSTTTGLA